MLRRTFCLLLLLLGAPLAAAADLDTLGPLAPYVKLNPQGDPWRLRAESGALVVENRSAPERITYYYVQPRQHPIRVSARVTASEAAADAGLSGGGLLYALQGEGEARRYYVFLLSPDGTLRVIRRDAAGTKPMLETRADGIDPTRPVELAIVETGNGAEFHADGRRIGTIRSSAAAQGSVGIAAIGTGRFSFRDFRLGAADRQ